MVIDSIASLFHVWWFDYLSYQALLWFLIDYFMYLLTSFLTHQSMFHQEIPCFWSVRVDQWVETKRSNLASLPFLRQTLPILCFFFQIRLILSVVSLLEQNILELAVWYKYRDQDGFHAYTVFVAVLNCCTSFLTLGFCNQMSLRERSSAFLYMVENLWVCVFLVFRLHLSLPLYVMSLATLHGLLCHQLLWHYWLIFCLDFLM